MIGPILGPFLLRTVDLRSSHCRFQTKAPHSIPVRSHICAHTSANKSKKANHLSPLAYLRVHGCSCHHSIDWRAAALVAIVSCSDISFHYWCAAFGDELLFGHCLERFMPSSRYDFLLTCIERLSCRWCLVPCRCPCIHASRLHTISERKAHASGLYIQFQSGRLLPIPCLCKWLCRLPSFDWMSVSIRHPSHIVFRHGADTFWPFSAT